MSVQHPESWLDWVLAIILLVGAVAILYVVVVASGLPIPQPVQAILGIGLVVAVAFFVIKGMAKA
jgi:hypothetical protein